MSKHVLDASVLLAVLMPEPGINTDSRVLHGAAMSAASVMEVFAACQAKGLSLDTVRWAVNSLRIEIVSLDAEHAYLAGSLDASTNAGRMSLGERACLALAKQLGLPAVTTDPAWRGHNLGVEVVLLGDFDWNGMPRVV